MFSQHNVFLRLHGQKSCIHEYFLEKTYLEI